MKRIWLIATILVLSTAQAYATNEDISEFEHHAGAKQVEVTPRINQSWASYRTSRTAPGVNHDSDRLTQTLGHVSAEYGLIPQLAVGADLGFSTASTWALTGSGKGPRTNKDGFDDVLIYGRGHVDLGRGKLAYGLNADVATAKQVYKADGNVTSSSGGYFAQPYVGYEMKLGAGTAGVQANYLWQGERKIQDKTAGGSDFTLKGGDQVGAALFYEHEMKSVLLGAAFIFNHVADSQFKASGVSTKDGNNQFGARLYAPVRIASNIEILPEFDWVHTRYKSATYTYAHANSVAVQLGARFSF